MKSAAAMVILTFVILSGGFGGDSGKALARGLYGGPTIWLSCENRREYPIRPIAISEDGDLVTGYLGTGRGRGLHVRLIPMGGGYRYAGTGVWFDGWRESVYLYLRKYHPIACTVVRGPEPARG